MDSNERSGKDHTSETSGDENVQEKRSGGNVSGESKGETTPLPKTGTPPEGAISRSTIAGKEFWLFADDLIIPLPSGMNLGDLVGYPNATGFTLSEVVMATSDDQDLVFHGTIHGNEFIPAGNGGLGHLPYLPETPESVKDAIRDELGIPKDDGSVCKIHDQPNLRLAPVQQTMELESARAPELEGEPVELKSPGPHVSVVIPNERDDFGKISNGGKTFFEMNAGEEPPACMENGDIIGLPVPGGWSLQEKKDGVWIYLGVVINDEFIPPATVKPMDPVGDRKKKQSEEDAINGPPKPLSITITEVDDIDPDEILKPYMTGGGGAMGRRRYWQCAKCSVYLDALYEKTSGIPEIALEERVSCPRCGSATLDSVEGEHLREDTPVLKADILPETLDDVSEIYRDASAILDETEIFPEDTQGSEPEWPRGLARIIIGNSIVLSKRMERIALALEKKNESSAKLEEHLVEVMDHLKDRVDKISPIVTEPLDDHHALPDGHVWCPECGAPVKKNEDGSLGECSTCKALEKTLTEKLGPPRESAEFSQWQAKKAKEEGLDRIRRVDPGDDVVPVGTVIFWPKGNIVPEGWELVEEKEKKS